MADKIDPAAARIATKKFISIFGGILMFVGLLILIAGIYNVTLALLSHTWPTVKGRIMESRIVSQRQQSTTAPNQYITIYSPKIRYQYTIDGTKYENNRIRFSGAGGSDRKISDKYVRMFPVNKSVNVSYSPGDKNNSVLIRGADLKTNIGTLVAGILFFLVGFIFYKLRHVFANSIPD